MSNHIDETNRTPKNKVLAGVILLAVGGVLLVKQFNFFFFPNWLLSWPLGLIVLGLYFGAKHNFRKPVWFILIIVGAFNLLDDIFPRVNWGDIGFPVILISFGLWIIMRKRNEPVIPNSDYWDKKYKANPFGNPATATEKPLANFDTEGAAGPETAEQPIGSIPPPTPDDYLNATAIFGGVNKTILSKNFQGAILPTYLVVPNSTLPRQTSTAALLSILHRCLAAPKSSFLPTGMWCQTWPLYLPA